jgi:hypothetical protein
LGDELIAKKLFIVIMVAILRKWKLYVLDKKGNGNEIERDLVRNNAVNEKNIAEECIARCIIVT